MYQKSCDEVVHIFMQMSYALMHPQEVKIEKGDSKCFSYTELSSVLLCLVTSQNSGERTTTVSLISIVILQERVTTSEGLMNINLFICKK